MSDQPAAVNALAAFGADRPVAVLADDVQWLDPQSQEVLTFIARRAAPHPFVIICAIRTGHPSPFAAAGLPELAVGGVDEAAADEILQVSAGVLNPAERRRFHREARGNPLALLELPRASAGPAAADERHPPALSARLERAFGGRLAELPPLTRDAVLVASAGPESALAEILAAASAFTGSAVASVVFGPPPRLACSASPTARSGSGIRWCDQVCCNRRRSPGGWPPTPLWPRS